MNKTIEEAAWNFARKQWGKQVPHTIDKIADMLIDFGNEIRTMPLRDRLTSEEKKRVRKAYKAMSYYGKKKDVMCADCANYAARVCMERIFGAEFFKEGK